MVRKIAIYADGADLGAIAAVANRVSGFTTNPALMAASGATSYRSFAKDMLAIANGKPISFEVLSDDPEAIELEAEQIAAWGDNVFVKIPVMTTDGTFLGPSIRRLAEAGVKVNVTAITTAAQIRNVRMVLTETKAIISVFAGRIADAGIDPASVIIAGTDQMPRLAGRRHQILWASPREVYNVRQAEAVGCDIITLQPSLIAKLSGFGADLHRRSLETVREFHNAALGLSI